MTSNFQIKIDQEYSSLVPELSVGEYTSLRQSIKENGLYLPIIVNQNGIVLDGHHRYRVCRELGIELKTSIREFKDRLDEQLFVINCNLKRRQLNNFQRIELALKSKEILMERAKSNMSLGGKGSKNLETLDNKGVSGEIGKLAGVSHETVRKVEKVLGSEHITNRTKERLRSGELSISEAYEIAAEWEQHKQLNGELRLLDQNVREAREELANAKMEFYRSLRERQKRPKPTKKEIMQRSKKEKEKIMDEIMAPFMSYIHKELELWKAVAACVFWNAIRVDGKSYIEAATETLRQIEEIGTDNEHGTQLWTWHRIEEMIYYAASENKIDKSKIRDSKIFQDQLRLIKLKEEVDNRELEKAYHD
jgi:hypothetical protein